MRECVEGVAERILAMLMNEAADAVFWQVASPADIDTAMQKGVNYPKGLLEWATNGAPQRNSSTSWIPCVIGTEKNATKSLPCFATWHDRPTHVFLIPSIGGPTADAGQMMRGRSVFMSLQLCADQLVDAHLTRRE